MNGDHPPLRRRLFTASRENFHSDSGVGTIHNLIVKPNVVCTFTLGAIFSETTEAQSGDNHAVF
jgi:hypothetical protein